MPISHPTAATPMFAMALLLGLGGCALTPVPLSPETLATNAADKAARVVSAEEPLAGILTLDEAVRRALTNNLDQTVEIYETTLRLAELDLAHYNLLPGIVAGSGYAARDNRSASSSLNLVTGNPNFGYSTSQDQRLRTADLSFSWHVLDFGLSIVRARQAADKALLAEEARRKVALRIAEDVRIAYWRAWTAQKLVKRLRALERRTVAALAGSRSLESDRSTSPMTQLSYRRELIEILRTLQELQRELSIARYQLAALMNVRPDSAFTLAAPKADPGLSIPASDWPGLVKLALENRPEIRDVLYRQRINAHDADAALLELLPGINLFVGPNLDSNSFLLHDQWLSWGAKASWNLMKVFQYPARRSVVEAQDKLLDARALALTMAIMTQIQVSRARLAHFSQEVRTAAAYDETQRALLGHIRSGHAADRISEQALLREELNAVVGEVRLDIARASQASAKGALAAALGLDVPYAKPGPIEMRAARGTAVQVAGRSERAP